MEKFLLILFLSCSLAAKSQIITTYGGGGTGGICNGCAATASLISDPVDGVFDKYGNYYFASCLSGNTIREINSAGIITTVVGTGMSGSSGDSGLATSAMLNGPFSVKFDTAGNMYILDALNYRIRKVSASTGIITTIAGTGTAGYNGENIIATAAEINACDICLDKAGNIYVAEYNNRRVRKIDTSGIITTIAGTGVVGSSGDGGPAINAMLSPNGITIDDTGNLYIPDPYASLVREIKPSGIISTIAGTGTPTYIGDGMPATTASFQPAHICLDGINNLYISDKYNNRVFKIDQSGIFWLVAGNGLTGFSGDGGPATAASFNYASGVSTDQCGNLYITEPGNGRIRKVSFNPACWPEKLPQVTINEPTIYPNPAYETINIDNVARQGKYAVINITSIIEQSGTLKPGTNSIAVQALPIGVHLLQLTDNEGVVTVHKIVKQ